MLGEEGPPPEQQQMIEQEHDHQEHFAWYHEHMIPLWTGSVTAAALVAAAVVSRKKRS